MVWARGLVLVGAEASLPELLIEPMKVFALFLSQYMQVPYLVALCLKHWNNLFVLEKKRLYLQMLQQSYQMERTYLRSGYWIDKRLPPLNVLLLGEHQSPPEYLTERKDFLALRLFVF
jgi:hypothetical protein